ncbi:lytic transglycosylase domain-containing protein [Clostridium cadaveris]|uniref:Lytic transglycosylase domain-containing protein n=1 Tax=Clostridium cadaveris TaxID=1529 RepID=A0A1I2JXR5_9CLOT|nr:lytic transglycosylase domain-containing protein [Clostridium cadaveris]MDM8312607.1 lytic transglycosylase domain-containing protein [Clostridium cadaveris]NME64360.1 lytic transglycosylase domain-containing protein [Clostridium cadaveris]NWK12016.1 lytic transglycosylase domain-containing protein [Clostridium cadaveris]PWL55221.1 MAG: lytic transglycosylase domain-containing protein [Clostridium cadaveris]UFH63948.1 lytic transglycosylase domain-containing protein [Clostridium cadaveris]
MKLIKRIIIPLVSFLLIILLAKTFITALYPFKYKDIIIEEAKKYDISPYLVASVIKAESSFNSDARSHKNAKGLMQITEETAYDIATQMGIEGYDVSMLHEPEVNIAMGCWYLNDLSKEFNGNMDLVLAAYNAGRGNVQKWLKDNRYSSDGETLSYIPFAETDKYVKKVKVNFDVYRFLYCRKK